VNRAHALLTVEDAYLIAWRQHPFRKGHQMDVHMVGTIPSDLRGEMNRGQRCRHHRPALGVGLLNGQYFICVYLDLESLSRPKSANVVYPAPEGRQILDGSTLFILHFHQCFPVYELLHHLQSIHRSDARETDDIPPRCQGDLKGQWNRPPSESGVAVARDLDFVAFFRGKIADHVGPSAEGPQILDGSTLFILYLDQLARQNKRLE